MTELRIRLYPELYVAALDYSPPPGVPVRGTVLAAHGWMDNAASFALLAPRVAALGLRVVAIDLPGHGRSDHRPPSAYYHAAEYAASILDVADALGLARFGLLGHSLGASCSALVAGGAPARVVGAALIENLGPASRPAADAPAAFAASIAARAALAGRGGSPPAPYASVAAAAAQRVATVARYDGHQTLSAAAAEALVRRALEPADAGSGGGGAGDLDAGPVRFRHDRRIAAPSLTYATEEQVLAFLAASRCPLLLVRGDRGWPVAPDVLARRLAAVEPRCTFQRLPGSHHLHLDADTAPAVADAVARWCAAVLLPAFDYAVATAGAGAAAPAV